MVDGPVAEAAVRQSEVIGPLAEKTGNPKTSLHCYLAAPSAAETSNGTD